MTVHTQAAPVERLAEFARQIRLDVLLQIKAAGSGHPGGSLSCADIMAVLFGYATDVAQLGTPAAVRDHVILSKGHAAPALYAALAGVGVIPQAELTTLRQFGSRLQGHPDRTRLPEVEMSTGSLGQGLSVGCGLAWWLNRHTEPAIVYVVLGDGELDSGNTWEAIAFAGAHPLRRLVAIVDANEMQNDGRVEDILDLRPYAAKFAAFGWQTREIDGNDIADLVGAVDWVRSDLDRGPHVIIAHTTKGKGVSFMEGRREWHSHALDDKQYEAAVNELKGLGHGEAAR
jgi:transketolase